MQNSLLPEIKCYPMPRGMRYEYVWQFGKSHFSNCSFSQHFFGLRDKKHRVRKFFKKKSKKCLTFIRTSANMSLSAPLSEDEKSKKFKKLFKKCLTKFRTYDKMSSSTFKVAKRKSKTRHESFLSDRDNASLYYAEISRLI